MYHELSVNQAAAVGKDCPNCGAKETMAKEWTRNGQTVKCQACKHTINRPRGRAVAKSKQAGPGVPGTQQHGGSAPPEGTEGSQPARKESQQEKEARERAENEQEQAERQEMQEMLEQMVADKVEEKVTERVGQKLTVEVKQENGSTTTQSVTNAHPLLAQVLKRIQAGIRNFLFVGPSGSGKTTLAEQIAAALNCLYNLTPCSGGLTEGKIIGRITPDGNYLTTAFVTAYEQAAVHNFDEFDKLDPNVPACIHAAIENGRLFLPDRVAAPVAHRHAMNIHVATCNTWGRGANMMYVGANQIDAAMLSRHACGIFFVDYDTNLEASLVPEADYRKHFWEMRGRIAQHQLKRIWGTRELIRGAQLLRAGEPMSEVFDALTVGYTADERAKVGI